MIVLNTYFYAK